MFPKTSLANLTLILGSSYFALLGLLHLSAAIPVSISESVENQVPSTFLLVVRWLILQHQSFSITLIVTENSNSLQNTKHVSRPHDSRRERES